MLKFMTILYLHGLESKLNPEKRTVLERFGTVVAPDLDYYSDPNVFISLMNTNEKNHYDVVMGSSMGGFMGYYIANTIKCPALLFNPALPHRPVNQEIPVLNPMNASPQLTIALGGEDQIIKANDTLKWLSKNRIADTDFQLFIHKDMGHQVPIAIFEIEVTRFFDQYNFSK